MRRRAGVSAVLLAAALIAGCSTASDTISIGPQDVYDIDFISELVRVDAADWELSQRDPAAEPVASTVGGPESQLLVGPATLTLADGTVVDVGLRTPGGNFCPLIPFERQPPDGLRALGERQVCVVVGAFDPGTTTATWFSTQIYDRANGELTATARFHEGEALLNAGAETYFALPYRADVEVGCEMTISDVVKSNSGYTVWLTPSYEITAIECLPTG